MKTIHAMVLLGAMLVAAGVTAQGWGNDANYALQQMLRFFAHKQELDQQRLDAEMRAVCDPMYHALRDAAQEARSQWKRLDWAVDQASRADAGVEERCTVFRDVERQIASDRERFGFAYQFITSCPVTEEVVYHYRQAVLKLDRIESEAIALQPLTGQCAEW